MGISIAAGLVGGLLWFLLWRRFNMNGGALVLMGLVMGFLLAALIFATPFGMFVRRQRACLPLYATLLLDLSVLVAAPQTHPACVVPGDIHAFTNGFNYSMAFACLAIIWPVVLLLKGRLVRLLVAPRV